MKASNKFRLQLGKSLRGERVPARAQRRLARATPAKATISSKVVAAALKRTTGAPAVIKQVDGLLNWPDWFTVASFSVCQKTGTATYLDIWDADHFDGFTDMQRCLTDCRVWFSAEGFSTWGAPQTKTGRINCYFRAPTTGNYVCNAQLQSFGGPAMVDCLIDSFDFGPLPFNGAINQPHPANLSAGYHSFRIRQMSGSFFFLSLTVWKV